MTLHRTMLTGTAGLIAVAALATGCTPSSSPAASLTLAPSSPATTTPAAAAPTSPTSAVTSPATSSPGTPGAAGTACATRDLKVTVGTQQGAAGSIYQFIVFTNISGAACTLFGYPGVALAGGTPVTQIGAAAARSPGSSPRLVTLSPGKTANAVLRITQAENYPASRCVPKASTHLQIYPPNQTTPVYLAYRAMACSSSKVNLLTIGVVQPGSGG